MHPAPATVPDLFSMSQQEAEAGYGVRRTSYL